MNSLGPGRVRVDSTAGTLSDGLRHDSSVQTAPCCCNSATRVASIGTALEAAADRPPRPGWPFAAVPPCARAASRRRTARPPPARRPAAARRPAGRERVPGGVGGELAHELLGRARDARALDDLAQPAWLISARSISGAGSREPRASEQQADEVALDHDRRRRARGVPATAAGRRSAVCSRLGLDPELGGIDAELERGLAGQRGRLLGVSTLASMRATRANAFHAAAGPAGALSPTARSSA